MPGTLAITPASSVVFVNGAVAFQALESGVPTANVRWAVNGLTGGDSTVGTISSAGVYTAPATLAAQTTMSIGATLNDAAAVSASASVTILPPQPMFLGARSVSLGIAPLPPAGFASTSLAINVAPAIVATSPATGSRNTVVTVTLTGSGFTGATALTVLLTNAPDPNVTVANLVVDGSGTHATADLSIGSGAALGPRVLQITTPAGASTRQGFAGNLFTVQ